jgi:hypothetical protein
MRVAILIAPAGFRDETVSITKKILEKWGVETIITSYTSKNCMGNHGAVYKPFNTSQLIPLDYDGIILADGPGVEQFKLYDLRQLHDLLMMFIQSNKLVAGVGNAIKIIARTNMIQNMKIANTKDQDTNHLVKLFKGVITNSALESDKNIVTLGDSELIYEFADTIVSKLGIK